MSYEELHNYILSKPYTTFDYPFDEKVIVYRISDKIFALSSKDLPVSVNLKCDPIYSLELRNIYEGVIPGYHMNKKHWNTIYTQSDVDTDTIKELIDHSYELIFQKLSKKKRTQLV